MKLFRPAECSGGKSPTLPSETVKVYPSHVEEVIYTHPFAGPEGGLFPSHRLRGRADEPPLVGAARKVEGLGGEAPREAEPCDTLFDGLCRFNQDFREAAKTFPHGCVDAEVYTFETGPFSGRDLRVKNRYVSER